MTGNGDNGCTSGRGPVLIVDAHTDERVQRRVGERHTCARCGHVVTHPDAGELRRLAKEHAGGCN